MMRERHHHAGAREFALLVTWRWRLAWHWLGWVLLVGSSSWAIDLRWSELPPLPNEHGWGGPYVGVHDDVLIVAGGANFPQGPPWGDAPGPKVWYDTVFVLQQPDGEWLPAGRLPRRLAYGGCISRTDGCWLLGGEEDGRAVSDVYRLTWDRQHQRVRVSSGPSLPFPAAYLAAAGDDNGMFVAASRRRAGAERMNEKYFGFWAGPAAEEAAGVEGHDGRGWESLPTWPGAPRHKAAACWQPGTDGNGAFYLISGSRPFWRPDNTQDLAKFEFLTDGYRFDPQAKTWHALPPLPRTTDPSAERGRSRPPRPAAAAPVAAAGSSVLIFGGATGEGLTLPVQERPAFPRDVYVWDGEHRRWVTGMAKIPTAVVTTGAVWWRDRIVIPTGETRPGVRTPRVQTAQVVKPQ